MKRLLQTKKRRSTSRKSLKHLQKIFRIMKVRKQEIIQINSPYNSSQFLIDNCSTPFFDEEDENDLDIGYIPSAIILLKENGDYKDENSINSRKNSSFSTQNKSSFLNYV